MMAIRMKTTRVAGFTWRFRSFQQGEPYIAGPKPQALLTLEAGSRETNSCWGIDGKASLYYH